MIRTFDYDDVQLLPKRNVLESRSAADTVVQFGPAKFGLPIVPANMSSIIDVNLAQHLANSGIFYIMHRFGVNVVEFNNLMHDEGLLSSISLGVKAEDHAALEKLAGAHQPPEYVTIDVAHGHSLMVDQMLQAVRAALPDTFIIAGNIGTVSAALELESFGADAVKVGLGPGSACLTSPNTGFGTRGWQLAAVHQIANKLRHTAVIADGGIKNYGDIAKSIALGADMVMLGGMLAAHEESPGETVTSADGTQYKLFYGSASAQQKQEARHVEGKEEWIECRGSIQNTLTAIKENLQSSISYAGGTRVMALRDVEYVLLNNH